MLDINHLYPRWGIGIDIKKMTAGFLPIPYHMNIISTDKAGNEQVTAKEITRKKTSQNTPGFELIGLFVTLTIGAVLVNRRP